MLLPRGVYRGKSDCLVSPKILVFSRKPTKPLNSSDKKVAMTACRNMILPEIGARSGLSVPNKHYNNFLLDHFGRLEFLILDCLPL